jgi:hypothetical protein
VTENLKILAVKMRNWFVQIMIRSGRGFYRLCKEVLSSTTGTQNFEIFQNETNDVAFFCMKKYKADFESECLLMVIG